MKPPSQQTVADWLRLIEFGKRAISFNQDTGAVLDEVDIVAPPGKSSSLRSAKRLSEADEFRFFTMGPVYVECHVPFDIISAFRSMMEMNSTPYDGPRLLLDFNQPVFSGLGPWDYHVEGFPFGEWYDQLVKFMLSQRIKDATTGSYWAIEHHEILIADPIAVARNEYAPTKPDCRSILGVFTPVGNRFGLKPVTGKYPPVMFAKTPPSAQAASEAAAILSLKA